MTCDLLRLRVCDCHDGIHVTFGVPFARMAVGKKRALSCIALRHGQYGPWGVVWTAWCMGIISIYGSDRR